jgi:EpsD family peptidyl-prolyl cis-trans isomerase
MTQPPFSASATSYACAIALLLGLGASLAGCGAKDAPTVTSQVAARVGDEEISVHQINQLLGTNAGAATTPDATRAMGRAVLEKLIDQQLALDQALQAKLNRAPEVVSQIEASRREILANAYLRQLITELPRPTTDETKAYFVAHPALFGERRIFHMQEVVVPQSETVAAALRGQVQLGKSVPEIAAWLKERGIAGSGGDVTRSAEQIPLDALPALQALKDGQTTVMENASTVTLVHMVGSQAAPVSEAQALPRINQFLTNQRINTLVAERMQALRAATTIAYVGDFALPVPATAPASTPAAVPLPAAVPTASTSPAAATRVGMEKGVAGLQ